MSPAVHDDAKFSQNILVREFASQKPLRVSSRGNLLSAASLSTGAENNCFFMVYGYMYDSYLSPFPLLIALALGSSAGTLAGTVPGKAHCPSLGPGRGLARVRSSVELQQLQGQEQEQESQQSAANQKSSKIQGNGTSYQVREVSQNTENPEKESGNRSP